MVRAELAVDADGVKGGEGQGEDEAEEGVVDFHDGGDHFAEEGEEGDDGDGDVEVCEAAAGS